MTRGAALAFPCVLLLLHLGTAVADPPALRIARLSQPPSLDDFVGDQPSATAAAMTRVENFLQRYPTDDAPVTERTIAYLGYDDTALYAVFLAFDRNPEKIRARLVNRDLIPTDDDTVSIFVDTFHDRKRSCGFQVNALGVQNDAVWSEASAVWDFSWDAVWRSEAHLTPSGYVALIAIPFKSLRFLPNAKQRWGVFMYRGIPRKNEEVYWPRYSRKVAGRLNQEGDLAGMEDISSGRNLQAIPYASFLSSRTLDMRDPAQPRFDSRTAETNPGVDAKMIVRDSFVVDATVNPDFSQVESDVPQETVNERFEVFFPEKRPFFMENASYFTTPINLLFTRRVVDPDYGVKFTGKSGKYSVGALVIDDASPGEIVPAGHPLAGKRAGFRALRLARDVGLDASFGVISVERSFQGSFNRVSGADGSIRLGKKWTGAFQAVASESRMLDGSRLSGQGYRASLIRSGKQSSYEIDYDDYSPGFRADAGFVTRLDIRQVNQVASYRIRPEGKVLIAWGPELQAIDNWNHAGLSVERTYEPALAFELAHQTTIRLSAARRDTQLLPSDFPALAEPTKYAERRRGIEIATSVLPMTILSIAASEGSAVNFLPPPGAAPFTADLRTATATVEIHPNRSLTWTTNYIYTGLSDQNSGAGIFAHNLVRTKLNYQLSRALSVRTILLYDSVGASAFTSLQRTRRINGDFLVTYLLHPGTALYVGYNSNFENIDPTLAVTPLGLLRTQSTVMNDGRQLFIKVSYLVRM